MSTVRPNPSKPACACGGLWYAKALCRTCYWRDYNARDRGRQTHYNHTRRKGRSRPGPVVAHDELAAARERWARRLAFSTTRSA